MKKAIAKAGGPTALARKLKISQPAVSAWRQIPAERAIAVSRITQIPLHVLRPDIYPPHA